MARLERKRRRVKTEKYVRFAAILVILCVVSGGSFVYAKYFSQSAQWGVAIASGVYFTANYAAESEEFFECNVKSGYTGGDDSFTFEVRNYENNLLFNESSVVIPYSVHFWLGKAPENASYTVACAGEEKVIGVGTNQKIAFEGQSIAGGSASANQYYVEIDVSDESVKHEPVPIYVEVVTAEGAVVEKRLRGKMVIDNAGVPESYIESQAFVVSAGATDDEAKFAEIQKLAAFTYEIRTVGEVSEDDLTEKLKLSWNPRLLELDLFDETYLEWLDSEKKATGATPVGPYIYEDADGVQWYYITLDIMPYATQTVNFLRGVDFAASVTEMSTLNGSIRAEKYQTSSEGTD